jgi:RHS repeat-associated protein
VRQVVERQRDDEPEKPPVAARPEAPASRHLVPIASQNSSSGTYLYDGAGNIKSIGTDTFVYDEDERLVDATVQGNEQQYTYDIYGNRLTATRIGSAVNCVGSTNCEAPVAMRENPSTTNHLANVTYDDAGNVTSGYDATYVYDGTGMVTSATVGSDIRNFAYTADDERIAVRQGVSWTWSVRDQGAKVLREFTSTETSNPFGLTAHTWIKDYVWRDGLLLASVSIPAGFSTPKTYHYHLDHLGTPRMITTDNGIVVSNHTYYPFGAEMSQPQENPAEAMKFTGHERDIVAGDNHSIDYMHARYYNGNLGRFLSVDPGPSHPEQPQSWNRYAYVMNTPMNQVDRNGRCGESASFIGPTISCADVAKSTFQNAGKSVVRFVATHDITVSIGGAASAVGGIAGAGLDLRLVADSRGTVGVRLSAIGRFGPGASASAGAIEGVEANSAIKSGTQLNGQITLEGGKGFFGSGSVGLDHDGLSFAKDTVVREAVGAGAALTLDGVLSRTWIITNLLGNPVVKAEDNKPVPGTDTCVGGSGPCQH